MLRPGHDFNPENKTVPEEFNIALDCPYCKEALYQPLRWFQQDYFTCPACGGGLAAGQFARAVADLEEAMAVATEEMVHGAPQGGGCGCGDKGCH